MKLLNSFLFQILIFSFFLIQLNKSQAIWIDENHLKVPIPVKANRGFCYSPKSERVRFKVECEDACDVLLVTKENFERLEDGQIPQVHFMKTFTLDAGSKKKKKKFSLKFRFRFL